MNYRKIEKLGIEISSIALGTWGIGAAGWGEIDDNESIETIRYMVERGVNVVDTAPVYGLGHSEEIVGKALEGIRDKVYLISKCGITRKKATGFGKDGPVRDSSKPMILKQVDESLERLKTDHLDVLLIHWPDVNTPFEETADALKTLKQQGKIRFSGICSQDVSCAMRPPSSFRLAEKKTVRARARRKGRQRDEPLYSSVARHRDRRTWYSSGAKSMAGLNAASRVQERGVAPVRSTMERQRYAWFQTTPHC